MNAKAFRESLRRLGLPVHSERTAALLGVTPSACDKYAYGYRPVHGGIAKTLALLELMADVGIPPAAVARRLGLPGWTGQQAAAGRTHLRTRSHRQKNPKRDQI
jgi:hypothetical protein